MTCKIKLERVEELRFKGEKEELACQLLKACFKADFGGRSFFQNRHHCRFLIWNGAQLTGHLAIAFRAIQMGNDRVDIIGIGEVAVAEEFRRRGHGMRLVNAAIKEGKQASAEFAVLFGERSIYSAAGFEAAPNQLTLSQMEGARTGTVVRETNPHLMVKPLGERPWNGSVPIDLAGFSF